MLNIEAGVDYSGAETSADVVLYSEFASKEALEGYHNHPEHKAIMSFIMEARSERRMVDHEI